MALLPQSPIETEFHYCVTKKVNFIFPCPETVRKDVDIQAPHPEPKHVFLINILLECPVFPGGHCKEGRWLLLHTSSMGDPELVPGSTLWAQLVVEFI